MHGLSASDCSLVDDGPEHWAEVVCGSLGPLFFGSDLVGLNGPYMSYMAICYFWWKKLQHFRDRCVGDHWMVIFSGRPSDVLERKYHPGCAFRRVGNVARRLQVAL